MGHRSPTSPPDLVSPQRGELISTSRLLLWLSLQPCKLVGCVSKKQTSVQKPIREKTSLHEHHTPPRQGGMCSSFLLLPTPRPSHRA